MACVAEAPGLGRWGPGRESALFGRLADGLLSIPVAVIFMNGQGCADEISVIPFMSTRRLLAIVVACRPP